MQATCAAEGLIKRQILGDAVAHDAGPCMGSGPRHLVVRVRTRSPRAALDFSMEPRQTSAGGDVLRRVAALRVGRCSDNVRRGAARRCGWSCLPQFLRRGCPCCTSLAANVVRTTERRELRGSGCPARKAYLQTSRQLSSIASHAQDPSGDSRGVFFRKPAVLREEDVGLLEFQILAPQTKPVVRTPGHPLLQSATASQTNTWSQGRFPWLPSRCQTGP